MQPSRFVAIGILLTLAGSSCVNGTGQVDVAEEQDTAVTSPRDAGGDVEDVALPDAALQDADVDAPPHDAPADAKDTLDTEVDTATDAPTDLCADQDKAPPAPSARRAINDDPTFIQVYVNNIENLKRGNEQCRGDWTDLLFYMKTIKPSPDVFLVQQISNKAQLDLLVQRMNDKLPGTFAGVIAERNPDTQRSPCGREKALQTNAVIYRKGRFDLVGRKHVWQSWANWGNGCKRNHQARTKNVMVKLYDKVAQKHVTAASLHWATGQGDGPDRACAKMNIVEADQKVHKPAYKGDLLLIGGDLNEPDRFSGGGFRLWHRKVNGDRNGDLNYRDVIFRKCQSKPNLQRCLDNNWTIGHARRIDFLFAKDANGCRARMRRAHTVTFNEADAADEQLTGTDNANLSYSDHRAIRAELYY